MAVTVTETSGRKWRVVRNDGEPQRDSLSRVFIIHDASAHYLYAGGAEPKAITGIPALGAAHPLDANFIVESVEYEEGSGSEKNTIRATVNYARKSSEEETPGGADSFQVDEWGWDSGTEQVELTDSRDSTPVPVLNSAGDPFDSVPQVSTFAPTFTKVMKFRARQSCMSHNCKVNDAAITIGNMTCAAGTLLCAVSERRIFGDENWKYQYTVNLKYKTNKILVYNSSVGAPEEIGWDVAITDTGMREIDSTTGKKVLITRRDQETHQLCTVTTPALLDGQGHAVSETDPNYKYNLKFKAYERTTIPSWFYSEPGVQTSSSNGGTTT